MLLSSFFKLIFSKNLQTRYDAILEFSYSKTALARRGLLFGIRDKNAEVRARAANALGFHDGKTVVKALIKALGDTESKVRRFALDSLAGVGDLEEINRMSVLLEDRNEEVRSSAILALRELVKKRPEATEILNAIGCLQKIEPSIKISEQPTLMATTPKATQDYHHQIQFQKPADAHETTRLVKELAARMNSGSSEAQREDADRWAKKMLRDRQFHMLAAMSAVSTTETYYLAHFAKAALREAGVQAVDAIIDQLRDDLSTDLVKILIEIGDKKAVPVLKGCLSGKYAHRLSAYGIQSDVEKFIARFDIEVQRKIESAEKEEKEKLDRARNEVSRYDEEAILSELRQLCNAYATLVPDDPEIKRLEPIAIAIGERLDSIGGIKEMRRIFSQLQGIQGARTIEMLWGGIGEWRG